VPVARYGRPNARLWVDIIEGKEKEREEILDDMHCIIFLRTCILFPPPYVFLATLYKLIEAPLIYLTLPLLTPPC
jgi:hypothetical protein